MCFWILLGLIQTLIYLYPGLVNTMEGDHPKRYLSVRCISESHLGHSLLFEGKWTFKQSRVMSFWCLVNDSCTWCIVRVRSHACSCMCCGFRFVTSRTSLRRDCIGNPLFNSVPITFVILWHSNFRFLCRSSSMSCSVHILIWSLRPIIH